MGWLFGSGDEDDDDDRRRWLLLLLLLILVVGGAGVGTLVAGFGDDGDSPDVTLTPTDSPTPPGGPGTAAPTTAAPVTTESPATTDGPGTTAPGTTADPTETAGPTPTDVPAPTETVEPPTAPPTTAPTDTQTPVTTTQQTTEQPGDPVALEFTGDGVVVSAQDVAPGENGTGTITVGNGGNVAGNLTVSDVSVVDQENGIVGPEADVDGTPEDGELSEHLLLGLSFVGPDGTQTALYDTGDDTRPAAEIAVAGGNTSSIRLPAGESASFELEWALPPETGNVVQSDGVDVEVTFVLWTNED